MRLDDDQLLAIMTAILHSGFQRINAPYAVASADTLLREVKSRQPHPDCLCVHAIPDFDGIHHDSRCEKFSEAANAAYEDGYAAGLDEAVAVCRSISSEVGRGLLKDRCIENVCAERIEALKSQPSKEKK